MHVLEMACGADQDITTVDPETIAYAISAFAIMTQDAIDAVRTRLLTSTVSLTAVSRAVALYEICFKGIGFPHAMLCMLLEGPEGASLIPTLSASSLLPLWLAARHVGVQLAERAALPDALAAMDAICDPEEALEVTIALTHLLQMSSAPEYLEAVTQFQRLEQLTHGAFREVLSKGEPSTRLESSSSIGQCAPVDPSPREEFAPISPSQSNVALGDWTTATLEASTNASGGSGSILSNDNDLSQQQQRTPAPFRQTSNAGDICDATINVVPRPPVTLSLTLSTSMPTPSPSPINRSIKEAAGGCTSAITRLVAMSAPPQDSMDSPMDTTMQPSPKRQRSVGPAVPSSPAFRKEDVAVPRYDTLCFVVGGMDVHAVGFVLEARSSFLRGLLSTVGHIGERVIVPQLDGFTPAAMHRLFIKAVEWCYTGEVESLTTCPDSAFNLWALAEFLQIDGLQRYCEGVVESWFSTQSEVVLHSLKLAQAYASAMPLRKRVARHVLSLIIDPERSSEAEAVVAAVTSAGHAETLGVAIASELVEEMTTIGNYF